jgi:hypothetical protein
MENNKIEQINEAIDDSYKRIVESKRMKLEDIGLLYSYGITTGLLIMSEILKLIE